MNFPRENKDCSYSGLENAAGNRFNTYIVIYHMSKLARENAYSWHHQRCLFFSLQQNSKCRQQVLQMPICTGKILHAGPSIEIACPAKS